VTDPIEDEHGQLWTYDPERDRWVSDTTVFDWHDMRGWHPDVIAKWAARRGEDSTGPVDR
jgi:hypothetical protein